MILETIMNNICSDMKFTFETQFDYNNGFLPTLDPQLKLFMKDTPCVRYRFYNKNMRAKLGIVQTSSLSEQIKSNTITQEVICRLSNTSTSETRI